MHGNKVSLMESLMRLLCHEFMGVSGGTLNDFTKQVLMYKSVMYKHRNEYPYGHT